PKDTSAVPVTACRGRPWSAPGRSKLRPYKIPSCRLSAERRATYTGPRHDLMLSSPSEAARDLAVGALKRLLGEGATDAASVREHHSHGESYHAPALPDLVCYPKTTAEVAEILRISARHQIPIVPFGAGTSLEGHVHAIGGGISLDLR